MKKFLLTIAALSASLSAYTQGLESFQRNTSERIVGRDQVMAIVEDTTITAADLMQAMAPFVQKANAESRTQAEFDEKIKKLSGEMLQNLVDRVIIIKDFRDQGMMIPQAKLDGFFEDDIKKNFNGDRSEFLKYLQAQNKTIKQYRKEHEESIILEQMQMMKRRTASEVSPAKIIEYYEANKEKWYSPAMVKVRQISITNDSPEELKRDIARIHAELKSGTDFAEAAKKYSCDEYAKYGGLAGSYKKGQFSPLLDKAAFSTKVGDISDPVFISNYAYILKIEEKIEEGIQPLNSVRETIEWIIVGETAQAEYQKWLERLRKKAYIRYY